MEHAELRRLADLGVHAGTLPSDPAPPFLSTVNVAHDTRCSLCGEVLGLAAGFRLIEPERVFVLHTPCFSAWIDVVVEPKLREGAAE